MGYENVIVEREENIAVITVNRPNVLNALNDATVRDLHAAFDELGADDDIRVIIVTGAGEKAFVAGADINELQALKTIADSTRKLREGHDLMRKIEMLPKPVIMAINGYALGGGCELAMAGDIRIASETARIGLPEINLGLLPGYGGTQRLPRIVGKGMAKLMMLTGDHIDAQEALRIGLVEKVVPAAELMPTAKALAKKLASKAPISLQVGKEIINVGCESDLDRGLAYELARGMAAFFTEDRIEGTSAFLEKRKPQFKGR